MTCRPCSKSQSIGDSVNCLNFSKTASNLTTGISDANNTKAKPGNIISYNLTVTNIGKLDVKGFNIQDNISDILDYSTQANLNTGQFNPSTGIISWPNQTIPASGSITKNFTVVIKNSIPNNAPGKDDPNGYNFIMTNVYGNTINININPPVQAAIAQTAVTTLPNTGPGANLIIIFIVTTLSGYLYFRSKLIAKEAKILDRLSDEVIK